MTSRLRCNFVPTLALALAVGCTPAAQVVRHEHRVEGTIALEAEHYRVRGYDANDARLVRALDELEDVMGRRIAVRFRVELMPREAAFFEHFFESELGKLPKRLALWKRTNPSDFDAMLAELSHVDFDYDGTLPAPRVETGPPPERLRIVLNSWQLDEKLLDDALHRYRGRHLARRYLDVAPDAVPAAEQTAYADALIRFGAAHFGAIDATLPAHKEPAPGRSEVTLRLVRLYAIAKQPNRKLESLLLEALLEAGAYYRDAHGSNPEFVRSLHESSRFLRAKRAWTGWAVAELRSLPPEARDRLVELLLVHRRTSPRMLLDPDVFPEFDVVGFGFELLRQWGKRGHPTAAGQYDPSPDPEIRLFDRVLCPTVPNERGFRTRRARHCNATLYATSLAHPATRDALLKEAATTPDPIVLREIALNLLQLTASHTDFPKPAAISAVLELWQRLERDPARFRELARLLAVEIDHGYGLREALYDQTTRYYRARPADRGVLLFLLARIDGYSRTDVNWKDFASVYGAPIGDAELAVYFDQSYLAFEEFKGLEKALSGSPGRVLAPKLQRYLSDPAIDREPRRSPGILRAIIAVLSYLDDKDGIAAVRAELHRYVGQDPARERHFRDVLAALDKQR